MPLSPDGRAARSTPLLDRRSIKVKGWIITTACYAATHLRSSVGPLSSFRHSASPAAACSGVAAAVAAGGLCSGGAAWAAVAAAVAAAECASCAESTRTGRRFLAPSCCNRKPAFIVLSTQALPNEFTIRAVQKGAQDPLGVSIRCAARYWRAFRCGELAEAPEETTRPRGRTSGTRGAWPQAEIELCTLHFRGIRRTLRQWSAGRHLAAMVSLPTPWRGASNGMGCAEGSQGVAGTSRLPVPV